MTLRVPETSQIVVAWTRGCIPSLKTIWNRFRHSSSHIRRKTAEKVVKISRSRTLISTGFPGVFTRTGVLKCRYRLQIVKRPRVHPLLETTTIWEASGTRRVTRHSNQSRYPPLRYVLNYIASYRAPGSLPTDFSTAPSARDPVHE